MSDNKCGGKSLQRCCVVQEVIPRLNRRPVVGERVMGTVWQEGGAFKTPRPFEQGIGVAFDERSIESRKGKKRLYPSFPAFSPARDDCRLKFIRLVDESDQSGLRLLHERCNE